MKKPYFPLVLLIGIPLVTPALAVVNMAYVTVGNPGNAEDTNASIPHYGAVAATYRIGTYEVTNAQYCEFLNAKGASNAGGIYSPSMAYAGINRIGSSGSFSYNVASGFENKPVTAVGWFDAARFANWLGNGQGNGDMETGAYTLAGAVTGYGFPKNPGATVYLPNENEWYKAAYYNGSTATYSLYPNGQNSITTADANYNGSTLTDVGSYSEDPSSYGTFDQGGNVWEWTDSNAPSGLWPALRGGSWYTDTSGYGVGWGAVGLSSTFHGFEGYYGDSWQESGMVGFRVASVPEPTSHLLTLLAGGMILIRRKR